MTAIVMLIGCTLCAWLQVGLPPVLLLGGAKPPLFMALALYYGLHRPLTVALPAACLLGVAQDALGQIPLGLSSVLFAAAAVTIDRLRKTVVPESFLTWLVFGAIGGGVMALTQYVVLRALGWLSAGVLHGLLHVVGTALLGSICCAAVFPLWRSAERYAGALKSKEDIDELEWSA